MPTIMYSEAPGQAAAGGGFAPQAATANPTPAGASAVAAAPAPAAAASMTAAATIGVVGAADAMSAQNQRSSPELDQWINSYVHQPVLATPGLNYLNQVPINFDRCTELFAQDAVANSPHRARLIPAIESGAFMRTSLEVYFKLDTQGANFLMWNNGGIRDYVVSVFQHCGLIEPKEMQISKMFSAFDAKQAGRLGVQECLLLVDAVARTVFRADLPQASASSAAPPRIELPTFAPAPAAAQQAPAVAPQAQAPQSPQPLGTSAAASPFLDLLVRGRQDGAGLQDAQQPCIFSTLANHGQQMPATEVQLDGALRLVDGVVSLARILCQRAPTSVVNGGPHAEEVRQRLQAKANEMIKAQQAMFSASCQAPPQDLSITMT